MWLQIYIVYGWQLLCVSCHANKINHWKASWQVKCHMSALLKSKWLIVNSTVLQLHMLYSVTMQVTSLLVLLSVTTVTLCIAEKVNNATIISLSLKLTTSWMLNSLTVQLNSALLCPLQSKAFLWLLYLAKCWWASSNRSMKKTTVKAWTSLWWFMEGHFWTTGEGTRQAATPSLMRRLRSWWQQPNWNKTSNWQRVTKTKLALLSITLYKVLPAKRQSCCSSKHFVTQSLILSTILTHVIINAAITMGEKEGIIGHDYPPVLPFYNLARVLSHIRNNPVLMDTSFAMSIDKKKKINPKKECNKNKSCYYKCPPCKKHKCVGLCGAECSCWKWVCDTCCWQKGCCLHDYCCEKHGFFSVACFNVTKLKCNSFKCPK